jgi:hypothetical protein
LNITKHAKMRYQQRGILPDAIDLIVQFGRPIRKPGNVLEFRLARRLSENSNFFQNRGMSEKIPTGI